MSLVASTETPAVTSHRASSAVVGMTLFIASEVMFFAGLFGAYWVLKSAQPALFTRGSKDLSFATGAINTGVMIASGLTMAMASRAATAHDRRGVFRWAGVTLLLAVAFLCIKGGEYSHKARHHTVVMKDPASDHLWVYDGRLLARSTSAIVLSGSCTTLGPADEFDIHTWAAPAETSSQTFTIDRAAVLQDLWYGPFRNTFLGCYFALTGAHVIHLLGGMIALMFVWMRSARTLVPVRSLRPLGMYWQFVDVMWIVMFVVLYGGV